MGRAELLLTGLPVESLTFDQLKELLTWFGLGGLALVGLIICLALFLRRPPWWRRPD